MGSVLCVLHKQYGLILRKYLWNRCYYAHFIKRGNGNLGRLLFFPDEKTESQKGDEIHPM